MIYENIRRGIFLSRPNRFIAHVEIEGKTEICHVKNTGRCRELLIPGAAVLVQEIESPSRTTRYDLISVYKGSRLINMDSQAPNRVFGEWLKKGGLLENISLIRSEYGFEGSRFDFYVEAGERKILIEVKGVTLEENGVAMFPDAPTQRGVKHVLKLLESVGSGFEAYVAFVVQMEGVKYFTPNNATHREFGEALSAARTGGVHVLALDCRVTEDSLSVKDFVEVRL